MFWSRPAGKTIPSRFVFGDQDLNIPDAVAETILEATK